MKIQGNSESQTMNKKTTGNILHEAKYMQLLQGYIGIPSLIWYYFSLL